MLRSKGLQFLAVLSVLAGRVVRIDSHAVHVCGPFALSFTKDTCLPQARFSRPDACSPQNAIFAISTFHLVSDHDIIVCVQNTKEYGMTATITARVDSDKKRQAEESFKELGMTLSGAISVFINEVVQYQGIPFNIRRRPTANSRMEQIMNETDAYCRTHSERLSHAQVFDHAREVVNAGRRIHA